MKTILFCLTLIALNLNIFAQDKVYVSDKYGNTLKLILKNDKTYQLIYNEGVYNQEQDTLFLKSVVGPKETFTVVPVKNNVSSDSIEVTFLSDLGYVSTYAIAIATNDDDNQSPAFYPLYYYEGNSTTSYTEGVVKFKIKKEKYLYLAKKNANNEQSEVMAFEIKPGTNELQITENYSAGNSLVAVFNEKGNLTISENGAYPIEFILQDKLETQDKPDALSYVLKKDINIDWNFPSLYNGENYIAPLNQDTLKVNIETSLKDAIKNLKANQQSCLLIVNDSKENFDNFINVHKTAAADLKYYDETDNNIYDFSFYNLKDEEKNWLDKKGYSSNTKLIVLGYNEAVIYSSEESVKKLSSQGYYSYEYTTLARQIKSVANIVLANENLLNKKNSVQQLKTSLYNASVKLNHRMLFPDGTDYAINSETAPSNSSLDTLDNYDYIDPTKARLKGVFYKSTIAKQDLDAVWDKILDKYENDTDYDKELFHTIYKELNNDGFSMNLFGEQRYIVNENDFRSFDYLLKHYQKATVIDNNNIEYQYDYSTYFPAISDVKYLISNVLSRNLSDGYEVNPTLEQKKEIIKRYGNHLYDFPNDYYMLTTYLNSLIANKNEQELFSFYENFVSRFDTKNIIESLSNYYENNYELNWYNLKNDFSTMANNVCWYVVDNQISDPVKIKKAIEWSEMSLKLSRNNSYYMDTLAQLYYKNGDKQKAILTQEDAIKNYKDAEVNPDTLTDMKNVLERMKNSTY